MKYIKAKTENGFTLLELLVTMGAFAIIGTTIASILVSTLRNVNKSNVIASVRQNGDFALSTMTRAIRSAASLQNPSPPCGVPSAPTTDTKIQATALDNSAITYQCTGSSITDVNNAPLLDTNAVIVSNCSFTCSQASPSENPVITIKYTLQAKSTSNLPEQNTTAIPFQTSVVMRNISR